MGFNLTFKGLKNLADHDDFEALVSIAK